METLAELIQLRKQLHQAPELSGQEKSTAERISHFIQQYHPTKIISHLGGFGLAAIYNFGEGGPVIGIRCELDALPITEANTFPHRSKQPGVSHKCGHDGHMAIVAGLIFWLKVQEFQRGKVVLIFQAAEETGQGAYEMLQDERFQQLQIDYIFALHNLPGLPLHSIKVQQGTFSAAVQSMVIKLEGKVSHASEPENGLNPSLAIAKIIKDFAALENTNPADRNFALLTPIHLRVGEIAYGIAPGKGEIHYTLRTWGEEELQTLKRKLQDRILAICKAQQLSYSIAWVEYFPATSNAHDCTAVIAQAALENQLQIVDGYPLRFGEDFGWFTQKQPGAMFGLGAGVAHPALHHADYDFPDDILSTGLKMFQSIISSYLKNDSLPSPPPYDKLK